MSHPPDLPDVVSRAFAVSRKAGYASFCRNETGRLLATLAATRGGTMAEFGTGCGVGTAWLRSGVRPGTTILSAELNADLATAAQEIFVDDPQVEVLAADWSTLRNKGPYSLLFLDPSVPQDASVEAVADLVDHLLDLLGRQRDRHRPEVDDQAPDRDHHGVPAERDQGVVPLRAEVAEVDDQAHPGE